VLAQEPAFIGGHYAMPRRTFGRLRVDRRRLHDRHLLRVGIPRLFSHSMLGAHKPAIETAIFLSARI
jgi:hypothetical protein